MEKSIIIMLLFFFPFFPPSKPMTTKNTQNPLLFAPFFPPKETEKIHCSSQAMDSLPIYSIPYQQQLHHLITF
jgi:hypothetical protein